MRVQKTFCSVTILLISLLLAPSTCEARKAVRAASITANASSFPLYSTNADASSTLGISTCSKHTLRGGETSQLLQDLLGRLKIASYFALWYALNIVYNIINKKVLNVLPAPLTVGSIQFGVGALYAALLWILNLRTAPTDFNKQSISHIGFHHAIGQLLSMVSLGAGPVSFTHIVKALEPFFSAVVSALYLNKWMQPQVYATLLPVVGGVGYACLKERSFSWLAFNCAMGSNVAFALRAVLSKTAISSDMSSANLFGLVTWAAFLISIPIALLGESTTFPNMWNTAVEQVGEATLVKQVMFSGLFHYLNNEVMYLALSNVHPVTLAVGNTMKRVFIMVASVLVFRNPVSLQAGIGSFIGISGVLLYSLTKQHYEQVAALQEANKKGRRGGKKVEKKKKVAPPKKKKENKRLASRNKR